MKKWIFYCLLSLLISITQAQDLSDFTLLAHYPLTGSSAEDATDHYPDMTLTNTVFQGDEGVYANGIYIYSGDPDASLISTPPIDFPDITHIALSLEFKAAEIGFLPILVLGDFYRWFGAYISSGKLHLLANDLMYDTGESISSGQWYTLTLIYLNGESKVYLNGQEVFTHDTGSLTYDPSNDSDREISNTHFGLGFAFKGNWRNLKIYSKGSVSTRVPTVLNTLKAIPNPTHGNLSVELPSSRLLHNPINIRLMDMNGRICFEQTQTSKSTTILLELSPLPPGLYYLHLNDNSGQMWYSKIMVH